MKTNREDVINLIKKSIGALYGFEGDINVTIEEINTFDNVLTDIVERSAKVNKQIAKEKHTMSESHKKKISRARKGQRVSEETVERIRQDSRRINVYQYTLQGELVAVWSSTREAQREGGYNNSAISKCCRGKQKTVNGYIWKYKPIGEPDISVSIQIEKKYKNAEHFV